MVHLQPLRYDALAVSPRYRLAYREMRDGTRLALKEQGIARDPQIHIAPKAQALNEIGYRFDSQDYLRGERSIPYTMLDQDIAPSPTTTNGAQ